MPLKDGVQQHLIRGGTARHEHTTPLSDVMQQYDYMGEVNYPDPMADYTAGVGPGLFEGNGLGTIMAASEQQAAGLDSGAGISGDMVDMASANDNSGGAGGGPSADAYGPRNTGR